MNSVYSRLSLISYMFCLFLQHLTIMLTASPLLSIPSATVPFRPASSLILINTVVSKLVSVPHKHFYVHLAWWFIIADIPSSIPLQALFTHLQEKAVQCHTFGGHLFFTQLNLFQRINEICFPVILCINFILLSGATQIKVILVFHICETLLPDIFSMF